MLLRGTAWEIFAEIRTTRSEDRDHFVLMRPIAAFQRLGLPLWPTKRPLLKASGCPVPPTSCGRQVRADARKGRSQDRFSRVGAAHILYPELEQSL